MSQMIDFTLPSCQPGRTLHAFRCVPEGEVRAVLQLSHGMVEFIDRYKPLAENLAARGILVTGNDHLGHGGSIRTKEDYGYFGEPDGNRALLEDLHAVTTLTKQLYPGVPYFLLGHSMGSFYARQYLCEERDELVDHAVYGLSCHDHKHDFTGPFEGRYEILQAVIGGNMIVGPFFDKFFRQIRCIVIDADRKSMICHIEGQIAAHDSHSDNADIM